MHTEYVRPVIDVTSVAIVGGTFIHILPPIAAVFTIIWTSMRIVEMWTGKPFHELIRGK